MFTQNTPKTSPQDNNNDDVITPKNRRLSGISKTSSRKSSKFLPMSPSSIKEKEKTFFSSLGSNLLIVLIWVVVILVVNNIFKVLTKGEVFQKVPFCDSEDLNPIDCITCPKNGFCSQGELKLCDSPYLAENGICTMNRTETLELIEISKRIFEKLAYKSGEFESGFINERFEEEEIIKELLQDNYEKFKTFVQENPQIGIEHHEHGFETTRGFSKKTWKCLFQTIFFSKNFVFGSAIVLILIFIYKLFC